VDGAGGGAVGAGDVASRRLDQLETGTESSKLGACDADALEVDNLQYTRRTQQDGRVLQKWTKKPSKQDLRRQMYCNDEWHARVSGGLTVWLGEKRVSVEVDLQVHTTLDDGSCALYGVLATAKDLDETHIFWQRAEGIGVRQLIRGMRVLNELAKVDGPGCPKLRWFVCEFMRGRGTYDELWNKPPDASALEKGKKIAEQNGNPLGPSASLGEQHAVAFLDSTQYFTEQYQQVLKDILGGQVAFVTVQYQPYRYKAQYQPNRYEAGANSVKRAKRASRSSSNVQKDGGSPAEPPERECIHFKNLEQEGTEGSVLIWFRFLAHQNNEETTDLSHYDHVRMHGGLPALVFVQDVEGTDLQRELQTAMRILPTSGYGTCQASQQVLHSRIVAYLLCRELILLQLRTIFSESCLMYSTPPLPAPPPLLPRLAG
jgi:hypothetical protein